MGFVALVVALSGTAVALPGSSTVDSGDIKNGQVKKADIGKNAVTSSRVGDGTLLSKDFRAGQLPAGPKGDKGDKGANGTNGTNGAPGATGPRGPSNVIYSLIPEVISVTDACDTYTNLISISLGAGTWLVTGSADIADFNNVANERHEARAQLRVVGNPDPVPGTLTYGTLLEDATPAVGGDYPTATLTPRAVVTTSGASTLVSLEACRNLSTDVGAFNRKIDALQVGTATVVTP